jgi:hypothetical protein
MQGKVALEEMPLERLEEGTMPPELEEGTMPGTGGRDYANSSSGIY